VSLLLIGRFLTTLSYFKPQALFSFLRNTHLVHVKRNSHKVKALAEQIAIEYTKGESILSLARANNFPPYLFARIVVETVAVDLSQSKKLTEAMRDPLNKVGSRGAIATEYQESENVQFQQPRIDSLPQELRLTSTMPSQDKTTRLAREVLYAVDMDPMYGPRHDKERNEVGVEYEFILEQVLRAKDIPFESEEQLRKRGTSRTPDVLLSCPVGVWRPKRHGAGQEWAVVCWIDSKVSLLRDACLCAPLDKY
jgi:hypothetical protein